MKIRTVATAATFTMVGALCAVAAPAFAGPAEPYKIPGVTQVVEVVDGDTLITRHPSTGETLTISVLGLDAPEGAECWAAQSADFARSTILGIPVQLSPDPGQPNVDEAGHLLRYVALDNDMDGDYAVKAVRNGAGLAYVVGPMHTTDRLHAAEGEARVNAAGLWSCGAAPAPSQVPAPAPTQVPQSNIVHPGAFCSGGTGITTKGTPMVCAPGSDGKNRWRSAN